MRNIKVSFRATFEQPIGRLNPLGALVRGPQPLEIFGHGERWQIRAIAAGTRAVFKIGTFATVDDAKRTIASLFKEQLQEWQVWGIPPEPPGALEQMFTAYEVSDLGNGKWGFVQDEDRTHIIHAPSVPPGAHVPPAACGAQVNTKCFINNRANVEPTCRGCADVWRREYRDK